MASLDVNEIWRLVPPEEKLELMSRAHSKGVVASAGFIILGCTLAVALGLPGMMWFSLILAPFVFQFAAGKAWRDLRPRNMLEFLAARSAARRFAFSNNGKNLFLSLIFRGKLENVYDENHVQEAMEAIISRVQEAEVWVALFPDAIVILSERPGGAEVRFAHLINEKLILKGEGGAEYSNNRQLILTTHSKDGVVKKVKLTSRYPAALSVFEKKVLAFQSEADKANKGRAVKDAAALPEMTDDWLRSS